MQNLDNGDSLRRLDISMPWHDASAFKWANTLALRPCDTDILPEAARGKRVLSFLCALQLLFATILVISEQRILLTDPGWPRYRLKTPYRDGTTHVMF